MVKYEYVTIHVAQFVGAKCEGHREIIDRYAAMGYRYAGLVPTKISDYGKFKDIDLIFEKEE